MEAKAEACLDVSPGDAAVVQPLLPPHDYVEATAKIVRLHVHDLMKRRTSRRHLEQKEGKSP